jgi:protein involved in polysaccharide export with SLBB domain
VAAAGGTKPEAALDRAEILRPSLAKSVPIDLRPGAAANLPEEFKTLQDGDMIVVPARQAMVAGAISKPGPVPLKGGENLLDVLNGAGGAGGQADVSRVAILRQADVKAGQGQVEEVDVRAVFEGDDKAKPLPLIYDGDIVFVPSKNEQDSLGFLRILTTITSLGGLYNLFLR